MRFFFLAKMIMFILVLNKHLNTIRNNTIFKSFHIKENEYGRHLSLWWENLYYRFLIYICLNLHKATLADFVKFRLYFSDSFELYLNDDFIFLQFDTKERNHGMKSWRKIRNLQKSVLLFPSLVQLNLRQLLQYFVQYHLKQGSCTYIIKGNAINWVILIICKGSCLFICQYIF